MSSGLSSNKDFQVEDLTWREQEVLLLLADRCSNREIAEQLHLAETTVKDYVSKILSKLYLKKQAQGSRTRPGTGIISGCPNRNTRHSHQFTCRTHSVCWAQR